MTAVAAPRVPSSRVPVAAIIIAGCLISMLTFGPRAVLGFFQLPIISENQWGRDIYGFALAIQNLLWGLGQPFAGAIADRHGTLRVLIGGLVLYAAGLALMTVSNTPLLFDMSAGVLIGLGLSGCSFTIVIAAFSKLLPPERRSIAIGAGTAAGSFGQFLFSPLGVALIDGLGWKGGLLVFAVMMVLAAPLAILVATNPSAAGAAQAPRRTLRETLSEAFAHPSYVLLVLGFFTCGFQIAFITVHMPAYFKDIGLPPSIGGWALATIGLFNIVGSFSAGWIGNRVPRRYLLSVIYFLRSVAILAFILIPASPTTAIVFGGTMGLLWLSTVPPTSSLVAVMFGTRDMAMLFGFVFFSHQVGGFLGVWLGGVLYEAYGSYDIVWWLSIALGIASAIVNLPIVEKPIPRLAGAAAAA